MVHGGHIDITGGIWTYGSVQMYGDIQMYEGVWPCEGHMDALNQTDIPTYLTTPYMPASK